MQKYSEITKHSWQKKSSKFIYKPSTLKSIKTLFIGNKRISCKKLRSTSNYSNYS